MFTAKRRGFIALLAALLLAALIAFGISMLPAASRTVPVSAEQETIEVDSDTSLQEAFNQAVTAGGGTVTLTQDITLDEYVLINYDTEKDDGSALSGNPKINFDLNGHVITISQTVTTIFIMENKPSDKEAGGAILRVYGATLNVTDSNSTAEHQEEKISVGGGIDGSNATNADDKATEINLFTVQAGGLLTFNGGTYIINDDSGACAYAFKGSDAASDGKIEIRGGSFINESTLDYTYGGGTVLVINQGNIDRSLIEISGGTFSGRNPAFGDDNKGGTFIADNAKAVTYTTGTGDTKETYIAVGGASQEDSTLVPEGATIVASDSFKTIGEEAVLVNTVYDIEALNSVLQNVAKTAYISLGKDITGSVEIPSGKTVTLDLNGHNLTGGESHAITNNGTLTVIGEGTVTAAASGKAAVYNAQGATATLNGGTYTRTADYSWYVIYNDGIMTLDGITAENKNSSHTASLITNSEDVNETGNVKATLTINSGTYFSQGSNAVKNDEGGSLIITGGEITSKSYSGYYGILSYGDLNISGNPTVYGQRNPLGISRAIDSTDTAEVTISGGTFETPHVSLGVVITIISPEGGQGKLDFTINGGKFDCAEGRTLLGQSIEAQLNQGDCAIDITSGAFSGKIVIDSKITTTISGGTFDTNVTKYLAEGLMQTADGVVIENDTAVAQVGDSVYSTLQAAIDAAIDGDTITLLTDSVSGNRLEIKDKTVTIALNGYSITRENAAGTAIRVGNNAALTVIGEGKIDAGDYGPFTVQTSAQGTGRLTVKGGTYSQRIPAEWLAEGCALVNTTSGDFEVTEGDVVATIASGANTYAFTTLRAAVIAAEDGETVKLNKDITIGMTTSINSGYIGDKALTIDLNGKTISSSYNNGYVISGYYNRIVGSGEEIEYIDVRLTRDLTITSSNGLGRIVLNGGGGIYITAAENAEINVNISNIIISGTIKNSYSPIRIDGSKEGASVFAEIDNVTVNVVNNNNNAVKAVATDSATVVVSDCNISIANAPAVTATQNAVAAEFTNSNVTIADSTFVSKSGAAIVFVGNLSDEAATSGNFFAYKTLSITNSIINGYTFGLSGNASEGNHGTIFNIENSTIAGTIGAGIFHPQVGILNILGNGNVISGTSAIELRGGSLNIEGGVFTATSTALDISANPGSGSTIDGAAIVVSQHGYNPAIQVSIAGGVFNGLYALYEDDLVNEEGTEDIQISVSGGMYNGDIYSENVTEFISGGKFAAALDASYIAEGVVYYSVAGGYAVVGESEFDPPDTTGVALAGGIVYDDLQAAVDAAEEGATITLLKDIEDGYVIIRKSIDIDLNGYSITSLSDSGNALVTVWAVGSVKDNSDRITVNIYSSKEGGEIVSDNQNINSRAVYAYGAVDITIENVAIINTYTGSDDKVDDGAYGFVIGSSADTMTTNAVVRNVTIFGSYPAVYVNGSGVAERPSSFIAYDSKIYSDYVGIMGYGVESRVENGILNTWWQTYIELNNTDLIVDSGNASEDISAVYKGIGIYHPMQGTLVINGGSVTGVATAVEMRIGTLIVKGGAKLESTSVLFKCTAEGSGWTTAGAAVAVSQHSTQMPINVVIEDGTLEGIYALYEADTIENGTPSDGVELSILDGTFSAVYSQNITGFISGGEFAQALDGEYIAPGYAFDEATGTVVSATLNNNALADVRAYLAAYGLLYGDIEDLAIAETPDALAQAIVNAYEAIAAATGEEAIAVAKMDAFDAIDAFIDNLNTVKAEAIAELEELIMEPVDVTEGGEVIKEAVVAMPTYIVSAINGAKSAAEVEKYVAVATAEINELIDMREQAADDQLALENQLNSIISALGIVQQAGGSWSSSFLAGIEESVNTAKDNIFTISSLLGRPTDEATAETIFGKLEEANANIQGVYDKLSAAISAMLTGEGGISSQLEELKGLVDENSALAADIDNVLATAGRIEGALGNINSNNTLSNVLEQMNNLVSDYQSTVTNAILNISTRLDQLQQNMPTDSTIANALRSVIAGVENDLDILKAEVDALDEPNGALVTAINEKIEAAFELFGNTFTSELDKLNGTIAGLDTAIDNLPETLDIEGIKQAIADAKSAAEAAGTKVDALTGEEGALTTIDGKIDVIDGVVDGIADAQESMGNALTTFATATDTALKGIQSDIDVLESKLNAMANTAATDKADILAKIAELKSAADDISEAIASLDGDSAEDLSGIAEDLAALQTALDGVKADIGNVSQQVGGVAEDNTNSMSNFAGLYLFLSALVVLAIAILIVVSVKKRR